MFCNGCGAQIPDNSRNCPYCGMKVFDETPNYNDLNNNPNMGGNMNGGHKFCIFCGSENDSDSQFCVVCGKPLAESQASANADPRGGNVLTPAGDKQKNRYRTIGIIGVGVIAAVVLILVFGVFSKRSYEDAIEQAMNAAMYGDMTGLFELIHPDVFSNQIDELLEEYDAEMEYEIRYTEELTGSTLASIQDDYDDYGLDVDEAMVVAVRLTITSDTYDIDESQSLDIYLVKIDGDWYLDTENTTDLFGSSFSFSLF